MSEFTSNGKTNYTFNRKLIFPYHLYTSYMLKFKSDHKTTMNI